MIERHRWHPPGLAAATAFAVVLGVSTGALWASGHAGSRSGPRAEMGAAAAIGPISRPGDRAGRGEPRSVPGELPAAATSGRDATRSRSAGGAPLGTPRTVAPSIPPAPAARSLIPPASTARPTAAPSVTAEVVRLTNVERAKAGCGALRIDARLSAAAQEHSADMATRDYFSHISPDGQTPWDRAREAGYPSPSAENIAMGYPTAAAVVAGWMASDGHRANILNCSSHAVGVGYDPRGNYWTQLFGYV
jgi:uncharacterized protein YkwD